MRDVDTEQGAVPGFHVKRRLTRPGVHPPGTTRLHGRIGGVDGDEFDRRVRETNAHSVTGDLDGDRIVVVDGKSLDRFICVRENAVVEHIFIRVLQRVLVRQEKI